MKTAYRFTISAFALIFAVCLFSTAHAQGSELGNTTKTSWNVGWSPQESVLAQVLAIRAKELEKITGIKFGNNWVPKVSLEWSLGRSGNIPTAAEYKTETETIYFTVVTWYTLNVQYKTQLHLMDPKVLAMDDTLGILMDHELGHALADMVSRRIGLGQFYSVERFMTLSREGQFGLNIVSEGIGTYFEYIRQPTKGQLSNMAFPSTPEELRAYSYEMIAFQGGYWLVHDVISQYGERGMVWLVTHPLYVNTSNMRASAEAYRERALVALANSQ